MLYKVVRSWWMVAKQNEEILEALKK